MFLSGHGHQNHKSLKISSAEEFKWPRLIGLGFVSVFYLRLNIKIFL
jgi:hypothetical protein